MQAIGYTSNGGVYPIPGATYGRYPAGTLSPKKLGIGNPASTEVVFVTAGAPAKFAYSANHDHKPCCGWEGTPENMLEFELYAVDIAPDSSCGE